MNDLIIFIHKVLKCTYCVYISIYAHEFVDINIKACSYLNQFKYLNVYIRISNF